MTLQVVTAASLALSFEDEPFDGGYSDPCVMHGNLFADGQHRLLVNVMGSHREMYKTADFETYTLVNPDWVGDMPVSGNRTFQDYVVREDGTFLFYQNDGHYGGGEQSTSVWAGTAADVDAGTITRLGRVVDEGDCGAFYDAANGLVHIYTENPDTPYGTVSSTQLNHWTTPIDDLLNPTYVGVAVDMGDAGTGDPDIFEYGGWFWLVCDYTVGHPQYWMSLYRSTDLTNWEQMAEKWSEPTGVRGGDFDAIVVDGEIVGFTEYTGPNILGIGRWSARASAMGLVSAHIREGSLTIVG